MVFILWFLAIIFILLFFKGVSIGTRKEEELFCKLTKKESNIKE